MGIFNPTYHIHIHLPGPDNNEVLAKLNEMATKQERFDAILTRIDAVTTDLAGDFRTFIEEARTGTVSDESLAKAEANVTKLEELAATKENPVPGEDIPEETQP